MRVSLCNGGLYTTGMKVEAIAAIGRNGELGKGNELLWHIPDDLKRFKDLSVGHPIILGRKTFESIVAMLGKPLPGRTSIVVTRDAKWRHEGAVVATSIEEALEKAKEAPGSDKVIIGGGAEIYALALPYTDTLHLTLIDAEAPDADSFFPAYEHVFMMVRRKERRDWNGTAYHWLTVDKKT